MIGRNRLARGRLAGVGIDRRHLDRPLIGDRANLRFGIAKLAQVAERDELQAVAGGTDFAINLEPALKLLAIKTAEGAVERIGDVARLEVEAMLDRNGRRLLDVGDRAPQQRPGYTGDEAQADKEAQ